MTVVVTRGKEEYASLRGGGNVRRGREQMKSSAALQVGVRDIGVRLSPICAQRISISETNRKESRETARPEGPGKASEWVDSHASRFAINSSSALGRQYRAR
jgi:hypothetical protein